MDDIFYPNGKKKVKEEDAYPPAKTGKKKSKKNGSKVIKPDPDELINEEFSTDHPDGIPTLLKHPDRRKLPEIPKRRGGPKCKLEEIVRFAPRTYQRLIHQIRCGVSFNVAAEAAGVNESTFYDWGYRGRIDFEAERDTYFARFYQDVRRAAANITSDCEINVTARNPLKFLTHGAARIFGNPWGKQGNKRPSPNNALPGPGSGNGLLEDHSSLPPDEAIDAMFTVQHSPPSDEEIEDEQVNSVVDTGVHGRNTDLQSGLANGEGRPVRRGDANNSSSGNAAKRKSAVLDLTPEQEFATLQVYEEIGQLTINDSLRKAFSNQVSVPNQ